jgi:hypothetical protein
MDIDIMESDTILDELMILWSQLNDFIPLLSRPIDLDKQHNGSRSFNSEEVCLTLLRKFIQKNALFTRGIICGYFVKFDLHIYLKYSTFERKIRKFLRKGNRRLWEYKGECRGVFKGNIGSIYRKK